MEFKFDADKYAKIIFNNHASIDFGLEVNIPFQVVHPQPDGAATHVSGRNGDLWQGNDAFNNVTETFNCTAVRNPNLYPDWMSLEEALNDWLKIGQDDYQYLQFSRDPNWAYSAMAQPFTLTPVDQVTANVSLPFNCKPLMVSIRGMDWKATPVNGTVINQTDIPVHPEWRIKGKGDFALTINDQTYYFDDVEDEITLNSDGNAWMTNSDNALVLCNDKIRLVNNDSPEFICGKNTVKFQSVTGSGENEKQTDPGTATCQYRALWKKVI